jgi:hypothetical protein
MGRSIALSSKKADFPFFSHHFREKVLLAQWQEEQKCEKDPLPSLDDIGMYRKVRLLITV